MDTKENNNIYDKLYTDVKGHISTFLDFKDWVRFKNVSKTNKKDKWFRSDI